MKSNAPEKIYIPRLEGNETFVHEWSATKFRKYFSREIAENVEYVRKDAFIEKVEEYIYSALNDGIIGTANIEDFMRLFKKYMEG